MAAFSPLQSANKAGQSVSAFTKGSLSRGSFTTGSSILDFNMFEPKILSKKNVIEIKSRPKPVYKAVPSSEFYQICKFPIPDSDKERFYVRKTIFNGKVKKYLVREFKKKEIKDLKKEISNSKYKIYNTADIAIVPYPDDNLLHQSMSKLCN